MRWQSLVLVALWAGCLSGCASNKIRAVQSFVDAPLAGEVLVSDTESWRLVALAGHRLDRDAEGRLELMVRLRNLSGLDLPVEILTVFHGPDGLTFEDEFGWRNVVIPGHSEHRHEARSDNAFPTSFQVFVRTPSQGPRCCTRDRIGTVGGSDAVGDAGDGL
jgi:hypothetical protein